MYTVKNFVLFIFLLFCTFSVNPKKFSQTNLVGLDFVNSLNGFLLTSDNQFVRTTDGGSTWTFLPNRFDEQINNFEFTSRDTGYATNYYSSVLFKTIDGGLTWDSIAAFRNEIRDIEFINSNIGFLSGVEEGKNVYKTTDGGISWEPHFSGSNQFITTEIALTKSDKVYVTSWCCDLSKSTDYGETWEIIPNSIPMVILSVQDIFFADSQNGFIVGSGLDPITMEDGYPILASTRNGGGNWDTRYFKRNSSITDIYYKDSNNGWILSGGKIFFTKNNFGTKDSTILSLRKFNFLSDSLSYGITEHSIYRSLDGWKTFEKLQSFTTYVEDTTFPVEFNLSQNYPNPFNPITTIKFSVHTPAYGIPSREGKERSDRGVLVTLRVYDILGNEITTLINETKAPGTYTVTFDAKELSSGIYFYKLTSGSFSQTRKMIYLK